MIDFSKISPARNPFTVRITKNSGSTIEDGTYPARGLYIIDLGNQKVSWSGQESIQHQVILGFELYIDDLAPVLSRKLTFSLGKKSNLRKIVESWLGVNLDQMEEFNLIDLLGRECLIQVQNVEFIASTGETINYAKIIGVTKPPKGYQIPVPEQTPFFFTVRPELRDMEVYEKRLTERQRMLCTESEDWEIKPVPEKVSEVEEFDDTDIPF